MRNSVNSTSIILEILRPHFQVSPSTTTSEHLCIYRVIGKKTFLERSPERKLSTSFPEPGTQVVEISWHGITWLFYVLHQVLLFRKKRKHIPDIKKYKPLLVDRVWSIPKLIYTFPLIEIICKTIFSVKAPLERCNKIKIKSKPCDNNENESLAQIFSSTKIY